MATKQVSEVPLGEVSRYEIGPSSHKRARVSTDADSGRSRTFGGASETGFLPAWQTSSLSRSSGGASHLPPVAEQPSAPAAAAVKAAATVGGSYRGDRNRNRNRDPRSASPTPSYASSSTFSAATTTATALSSRASLSSCRSSFTSFSSPTYSSHRSGGGGQYSSRASHRGKGSSSSSSSSSCSSRSSYSSSRHATSATSGSGGGTDYFPKPSSSWSGSRTSGGGVNRWRRGSPGADRRRDGSRDRYIGSSSSSGGGGGGGGGGGSRSSRDSHYGCPPPGRRSGGGHKDYASEADSGGSTGRKRNRSSSRERVCSSRKSKSAAESSCSGVECARCLEWCRYGHAQQRQPITRTLQMDYYVRTPGCKAAKSKHIDFIDDVAYSREQFIEETVFTCPFTGTRRDTVLERNMFPYDVPTDVEHWTLWSRKDLSEAEMEAFVEAWAAENHPHAVEWECDNNEGERSIDWFHVHVFFRLGCEDRTGVPRDPDSVYDGPYRRKDENPEEEEEVGGAETAAGPAAGCSYGAGAPEASGGGGAEDGGKEEEEEAVTDHE